MGSNKDPKQEISQVAGDLPEDEVDASTTAPEENNLETQDVFSLAPLFIIPEEEEEETSTVIVGDLGDADFTQVTRPLPRWLETLRAALGMRAVTPTAQHIYLTVQDPAQEQVEKQGLNRLIKYVTGVIIFALFCGICVWGYGRFVGPSNIARSVALNEAVQISLGQLERGDLTSASNTIEEVRKQYPGDAAVDFLMGYIAQKNGQAPAGKLPGVRKFIDRAGRAAADKDIRTALEQLNEALTLKPNIISVRLLRAGMLCDSGQPSLALDDANYIEQKIGANATTYSLRGIAYMALNEPGKAVNEYRQGLKLVPQSITLRLRLAEALLASGQYDEANREALKIHARDPENTSAKMIIGLAQEAQKQDKSALQVYRNILLNSPDHVGALNNLAYLLLQEKTKESLAEAEKLALRALNLVPDTPEVIDTLALVRLRQGKTAEAITLLRKGLSLKQDLPELVEHLHEALVAQGNTTLANVELQNFAADVSNPRMAQKAKELLKSP